MKVRADGNSNICFARLCFTAGVQVSAARKPYKLSHGVRTCPADCSKLGKTRIIEDANIWLVRNAIFFDRISICISNGNRKVRVSYNATYQNPAS